MARRRRLVLALPAAAMALLVGAGSAAAADSASISVTASNGASDPVAYIARVFTITGTATPGENLYMKHRPAGGAPCAPTAYSDPGRLSTGFYGPAAGSSLSVQHVWTWDAPGAWMFCVWLAPSETTIATPITQTILFRTPSGQIASSINPATPRAGQRAAVRTTGASEAPRRIWVKVRPASAGPCATSYDLDPGQSLIDGWDADGDFDVSRYLTQATPGRYLLCDWLAGSSFDALPVAGPTALAFNVNAVKPVVASVTTLNCRTKRKVSRLDAGTVKSVCLRYTFAKAPSPGTRLSVSYVTPAHRTYKTVTSTWPSKPRQTLVSAPLPGRAYKHRRGTWRATLSALGAKVKTTTFRVV
jgi:hypothetical protein